MNCGWISTLDRRKHHNDQPGELAYNVYMVLAEALSQKQTARRRTHELALLRRRKKKQKLRNAAYYHCCENSSGGNRDY